MKNKFLKISLLILASLSMSVTSYANERFRDGGHYKRVAVEQPKPAGKIEITEFFLYSCQHCYELEPKLKKWIEKNKDKVVFKRVPAVITPAWATLAKAYYVAEKFGVLEQTHDALMKSIHVDKKLYLNEASLGQFYEGYGISYRQFLEAFNSKEVIKKVSDARVQSVNYRFRGVPAIVVNNEFKTAPFYNRSQEEMLEVLDYLLEKVASKS